MTLGFAVFLTEAVLIYSAPLPALLLVRRQPQYVAVAKLTHVFFHFLTLVCIILGLVAAIKRKRESPRPLIFPNFTLFSPHSWMGISALCLWALQVAMVFVGRLLPLSRLSVFSQVHRTLGRVVYAVGLFTCASGLQEKQTNDILIDSYGVYSKDSLLSPAANLVLVVLLLSVFFAWEFRPIFPTGATTESNRDTDFFAGAPTNV